MQDLITGANGAMTNIPDYAKGDSGLGDLGGESFPRLTFKGNRFRITKGSDEQVLSDVELDVIVLAANPTVSRIYYAKNYVDGDGTGERPVCASADGEVPLDTVSQPQSTACMTCPMNEKGSAISEDGGKRKACGYFHRLVLRLIKYPDLGEVVSEIKALSLFGESYPDKNLVNFRHYADRLNQHQTMAHAVITQMSFDTKSSVPKILFQPVAYVAEQDFKAIIHPLATSTAVLAMADTHSMRTGGATAAPAPSGFREKLLDEPAPEHAQVAPDAAPLITAEATAPAEPAPVEAATPALTTEQQKIAELQARIDILNTPEPEPQLTAEEQKIVELQKQIDALAPQVESTAPVSPTAVGHVNVHGVRWDPKYHATSKDKGTGIINSDGHWRARRGLQSDLMSEVKRPTTAAPAVAVAPVEPALPEQTQAPAPAPVAATPVAAASVAATPVAEVPVEIPAETPAEKTQLDAELDAALAEFDA